MSEDVEAKLKAFAEGTISALEFRDALYQGDDFQEFLENDPNLRHGNYVGDDVYLFLIERNYDDPGSALSAHGAVCDYLDRNEIEYQRSSKLSDDFGLLLDAMPKWLDVDTGYLKKHILPAAGELKGAALKKWLKAELRARFKFDSKPPRWIQSPAWPIGDQGPFVFLGQVPVKNYFHDTAAAYVFHDPATGECETIVQVM